MHTLIRFLLFCACLPLVPVLTGCTGPTGIYVDSSEPEPLKIPSDLDYPQRGSALFVPGVSAPELAGLEDAAEPPLVLSSQQGKSSDTRIGYGEGALFLLVMDSPESVYHRLGFTLNRESMEILNEDPAVRAYDFHFVHPPDAKPSKGFFGAVADVLIFWSSNDPPDYSGDYQVKIVPDDDNPVHSRVYLYHLDGKAVRSEPAEMIFEIMQRRLG